MKEIKIIIADDHPIFRDGLKGIIEKSPDLKIVGETGNGIEALKLIKFHLPDVAVLDLDMPGMDGIEVITNLKEFLPLVKVVILTMHKDEVNFNRAFEVGVSGYIVKDEAAPEIVQCIKTVAAGREYYSPMMSAHLVKKFRKNSTISEPTEISRLTPSERRVLLALAELKTSKELAAEFGVSPRTIDNQRAQICLKLDLQGTHALIKFALKHKDQLC